MSSIVDKTSYLLQLLGCLRYAVAERVHFEVAVGDLYVEVLNLPLLAKRRVRFVASQSPVPPQDTFGVRQPAGVFLNDILCLLATKLHYDGAFSRIDFELRGFDRL